MKKKDIKITDFALDFFGKDLLLKMRTEEDVKKLLKEKKINKENLK